MKIVVNTRHITPQGYDGIGRFTFEIFKRLALQQPQHEFVFLFDRPFDKKYITASNITGKVLFPPTKHAWLIKCWYQLSLTWFLKRNKADIFVSTDGLLSNYTHTPQLAVIHDLNFIHVPDLKSSYTQFFKKFYAQSASKAARIATVSQFSKQDIAGNYHVPLSKIDVVYNAAADFYKPLPLHTQQEIRNQYTSGKPYFIFVGSLHQRKNIIRILQAFEALSSEQNQFHLVIAGNLRWASRDINKAYEAMQHKNKVVFTNRISDTQLHQLLASAKALVYPSLFEGFGIPIIEAFACHVPVIAGNNSAMPEIAGNAALLVDANCTEAIKNAMAQIVTQPDICSNLIESGKIRVQYFNWDKSASAMWQSILNTISQTNNA